MRGEQTILVEKRIYVQCLLTEDYQMIMKRLPFDKYDWKFDDKSIKNSYKKWLSDLKITISDIFLTDYTRYNVSPLFNAIFKDLVH